jgi:hypothetical protein
LEFVVYCTQSRPQKYVEKKVLQIEQNTTYRKYKESTMSLSDHPISQPSLDITPIIAAEVSKLQLPPAQTMSEICFYVWY